MPSTLSVAPTPSTSQSRAVLPYQFSAVNKKKPSPFLSIIRNFSIRFQKLSDASSVLPVHLPTVVITSTSVPLSKRFADHLNMQLGMIAVKDCTSTGTIVKFVSCEFDQNRVVVKAFDKASRDWLLKTIPKVQIEGQHLVAYEEPKAKLALLFLEGYKGNVEDALRSVALINATLTVSKWECQSHEIRPTGMEIKMSLADEQVRELAKIDFQPFWFLRRGKVTFLDCELIFFFLKFYILFPNH